MDIEVKIDKKQFQKHCITYKFFSIMNLGNTLTKVNIKDKTRVLMLIFFDAILINISFFTAFILKAQGQQSIGFLKQDSKILGYMLVAVGVKLCTFLYFKLYSSLWKYAGTYEMLLIISATFISNIIMLIFVLSGLLHISTSLIILTFFIDTFLIGGVRFAYRELIRFDFNKLKNSKRLLMIGGGEAGSTIIRELKSNPQIGSMPVAIIDDDKAKHGRKINGVKIVGDRYHIVEAVKEYGIDEIIIAIPSAAKAEVNKIIIECSKTNCKVKILPSVCQLINGSVSIQKVRDVNIEDLLGREPIKLDITLIAACINDKTILVTGGGGSIGSELCRQIASFGPKQLIVLDNYENNAYDIQNELSHKYPDLNLVIIIANIREKRRLENVFSKYRPQVVFHAAAHKHVPLMETNPTEAIKNNVFGTQNVADCAKKFGAEKFVLISTDKAVNPTNIMGATKRIAEMIIQAYNKYSTTEFVAVRFGNVLGSNGSVIPLFKKQIEHGGPVTVTHPDITRFFMTIPEAAQLVIQASVMAKGGEIFVLDMGEPVKIYDLAKNLIKLSGFKPDVDIKIEFTGLRPGEKLYEELLLAEEGLEATKNDKIFIAPPVFTDLGLLEKEIKNLNEILINNSDAVINYVPNIVPTYKVAQ